jgi:hypothetical protein
MDKEENMIELIVSALVTLSAWSPMEQYQLEVRRLYTPLGEVYVWVDRSPLRLWYPK